MSDSAIIASAAILAGGASTRFGSDKALHEINGRPMISIIHDTLSGLFSDVFIAGGDPGRLVMLNQRCVPDSVPGRGTLSGIHNTLVHARSPWVFCCGCDMPLIRRDVIARMIDELDQVDVVLPVIGGCRQPLHAFYHSRLLPVVEQILNETDGYLPLLFNRARVKILDDGVFADITDYSLSFVGINDHRALDRYAAELARL